MREIEQSAVQYSDLTIKIVATVRHIGFDQKWIHSSAAPGTHNAPVCQIST